MKVGRLGSKGVVNGLGLGDEKVYSFDVVMKDYFSESLFPYTKDVNSDESQIIESLRDLFITGGRLGDFAALFKVSLIQKLAPSLQKEGYEDNSASAGETTQDRRRPTPGREWDGPTHDPLHDDRLPPMAQPHPYGDPLAAGPRRPFPAGDFPPPDFEDEYEINRPPGLGRMGGERRPLNIGERDLYPPGLGPRDPFRGGGFGPMGGGGMHPTFDEMMGGTGEGYDPRYVIINPGFAALSNVTIGPHPARATTR